MNDKILQRIILLKEHFDNGRIPQLHKHEVNPGLDRGDRLNYLYFTLPVALNFQRSSPAMWAAALKTFDDPETNYLFYPEKVLELSREEVQRDLLKHKLALQLNKHTDIWRAISKVLFEEYNSDPRLLIKEGQNCVVRIKKIIQVNKKRSFPYLSGSKMANYWLYILHNFTDVNLRNLHKITIIPDTHVIQSSIKLGIIDKEIDREEIAILWDKLLKGSGLIPIDLHPVLWNWSRNNFEPIV